MYDELNQVNQDIFYFYLFFYRLIHCYAQRTFLWLWKTYHPIRVAHTEHTTRTGSLSDIFQVKQMQQIWRTSSGHMEQCWKERLFWIPLDAVDGKLIITFKSLKFWFFNSFVQCPVGTTRFFFNIWSNIYIERLDGRRKNYVKYYLIMQNDFNTFVLHRNLIVRLFHWTKPNNSKTYILSIFLIFFVDLVS